MDGSGCFVYKKATPERLEEHLPKGTLNRNYVVLDSNTLVPGRLEPEVTKLIYSNLNHINFPVMSLL